MDSVNEMHSSVANVRKPRNKSARWILVDFATMELAEEFKKILHEKKTIAHINVKINKLNIKEHDPKDLADNERQQYLNALTKNTFKSGKLDKYSNKLMVSQLPENVTTADLKELFPNHLNLDLLRKPKLRAILTYSTAKEAMQARMAVRPFLNGIKIRIICLLLDDTKKKRKTSENESQINPKKEQNKGSPIKKSKTAGAFVKRPRYFETQTD